MNEQFSYAPKSNFLEFPGHQEDVYEASLSLANYLKNEKINNVMFLDNSARQVYVGLKEAWKKIGDGEKSLNIYFINPTVIKEVSNFLAIEDEFLETYKHLNPEEPILVYDACAHSGDSLFETKRFLEYLGFNNVKVGIASPEKSFPESRYSEVDLIGLDHRAKAGCKPFGRSEYVEMKQGYLVSEKINKEEAREKGRMEHQKIKDVFNDQYEKNNN